MALRSWVLPIGGGGAVVLNEHPIARHAALGEPLAWVDAAEALLEEAREQMTGHERQALNHMSSAKRRAEWLLGRLAGKAAMAQVCALSPHLMAVEAPEKGGAPRPGGPYWQALMGDGWGLSLAHSAGRALALVAPGQVGCDLEAGEAPPPAGWRYFLSPDELAMLSDEASLQELSLSWWTAKEAAYKALGGVAGGLRALRFEDLLRPDAGLWGPKGEAVSVALGQAHFGHWAIAKAKPSLGP